MEETLEKFLLELEYIKLPDIKRHAKGLRLALLNSNRKEMLEYEISPAEKPPLFSRQ